MAGTHFTLVRNTGFLPNAAVQLAVQTDGAGQIWTAVAHTENGDIAGKAVGDTCWYCYNGEEFETDNFSWVVHHHPSPLQLVMSDGSGPPSNALKIGHQTDGFGDLYAAIAICEDLGTIPGKAQTDTCWFPCGGVERETNKFYWICHQ